MRRFLIGLLATVGVLTLLVGAALAALVWHFLPGRPSLPDRFVLTADWQGSLGEDAGTPDLLNLQLVAPPTVSDVVLALDAAAADARVAGLVARVDATANGFAVTQELRDAVGRFRASGKFAVAYADSFGELSSGNEGYYLATAFDEIDLQPVGLVGLTGLVAQVPLARELLASLGIRMEVARREEYKTALDSLTDSELSAPNREMMTSILDVLEGQLVDGIAVGRRLDPALVRQLIDGGPYTGDEAVAAGLVDRLSYRDEVIARALKRAGGQRVALDAYVPADKDEAAPRVALVRAAGLIGSGSGDAVGPGIAADDLAAALTEAAEDDSVRAVLLRIDSGGGSAVASETIAHAVRGLRQAGKPVVVSMSNAAASGGYWIAMDANRIVAQPGTLTGSIGVIAGKPALNEAWDRLGVRWAEITRGANASIWSLNQPYSEQERARVEAIVGQLYGDFKAGVARGRQLPADKVDVLAKGRVWAGATALGLGLVDELGGLAEAQAALRRELALPEGAPLALEPWPPATNPALALLRRIGPQIVALDRLAGYLGSVTEAFTARSLPLTVH